MTLPVAMAEFSDEKNRRTYVFDNHTIQNQRLIIQSRKKNDDTQKVENSLQVVCTAKDSAGMPAPTPIVFNVLHRQSIDSDEASLDVAIAAFRDLVASPEFVTMVKTQAYVV
jgi:hypothetical protein